MKWGERRHQRDISWYSCVPNVKYDVWHFSSLFSHDNERWFLNVNTHAAVTVAVADEAQEKKESALFV